MDNIAKTLELKLTDTGRLNLGLHLPLPEDLVVSVYKLAWGDLLAVALFHHQQKTDDEDFLMIGEACNL